MFDNPYNIEKKGNLVSIFCDGACSGNPGVGGWGALLLFVKKDCSQIIEKEIYGGSKLTTNNRMELRALIEALKCLKYRCDIVVYTDSIYVKNGIETWLQEWIRKGWKTAKNKPVKNKELWEQLNELNKKHNIKYNWIKGHSGNLGNEKADKLANRGLNQFRT